MSKRSTVVAETERLIVTKRRRSGLNQGHSCPALRGKIDTVLVKMKSDDIRFIELNIDELFDLAECLDDICDDIEDEESLSTTRSNNYDQQEAEARNHEGQA